MALAYTSYRSQIGVQSDFANRPMNNKASLVQVTVYHQTGHKMMFELVMAGFVDATGVNGRQCFAR